MVSRKINVVGTVMPIRTSVVASGANGVVASISSEPDPEDDENAEDTSAASISPGEQVPPRRNFDFEKGQYVTKGTVLSVLRMEATNNELDEARAILEERDLKFKAAQETHPQEVSHAEAMKKLAMAVETNARQKLDRTQALFTRGVANDGELEDAQERWKAASESLAAADENLNQIKSGRAVEPAQASLSAQQAHLDYLETEKLKRTTKAPINGFIVAEHTYVGQWLEKGDPVVTIAHMDEVDVMVNVDQADIPYVRLGQPVSVTVEGADPEKWPGRIQQIVPQSDWASGSRGFPVVVRIRNTLDDVEVTDEGETKLRKVPRLKAGMMARVTILGPEVETLLAPKNALVRTTRGNYLLAYDPLEKDAELNPNKPTMGSVQQVRIQTDLKMSQGVMIGIRPLKDLPDDKNPLKPGAWVVTEGGERLVVEEKEEVTEGPERLAPVQDNINALSPIPTNGAAEEG
jgi:multidrug resistance efflux pump